MGRQIGASSVIGWLVVGLAVRVAAVLALRDYAYVSDYLSYVYWGQLAVERGPLGMYVSPAERERPSNQAYRVYDGRNHYADQLLLRLPPIPMTTVPRRATLQLKDGTSIVVTVPAGQGMYHYWLYSPSHFNYPPATAYLYYALGWLHGVLDPTRTPETALAHVLFATPSMLCDVALALVIFAALRRIGGNIAPRTGLLLAVCCPALLWDSSVWLQTDSLGAVMMMVVLLLLLEERPVAASAVCGLGLLIKPQVSWMLPVLGYEAWRTRSVRKIAAIILAGAAAVMIGSAPFLVNSGLLWFDISYLDNARLYPGLSLNALNPWWLLALLRGALAGMPPAAAEPAHPSPVMWNASIFDVNTPWMLGVTPRTIGLALFGGGVCLALLVWQRNAALRRNLAVPAHLTALAAFLFPTAVHERYVVYGLPLAIVAATQLRSIRYGLWALNTVALLNVTSYAFLHLPLDQAQFSALDWGVTGASSAAVLVTLALFVLPVVEMSWGAAGQRQPVAAARSTKRGAHREHTSRRDQ